MPEEQREGEIVSVGSVVTQRVYYNKSNALDLLKWVAAIYTNPMYEFQLNTEKLLQGFESNIILDEVCSIDAKEDESGYIISTENNKYETEYVIVATEPWVTKKLLSLHFTDPTYAVSYVRQVVGTLKGIAVFNKRYLLFPANTGILSITKGSDGSYLVYTNSADTSIDEYFENYKIVYEKKWDPSFIFCSHELVESQQSERLWIAGDINFAGIEDSALTGIYAANQIIATLST